MAEDKKIIEQMKPLIGRRDFKSFTKYMELMHKSEEIQIKMDKVSKEMDNSTCYKEV